MHETNERTIHETNTGELGAKQNLACCENGSLCAHSNFFRVKSKIYCALASERKTKNVRTIRASETNEKRIRYEISVNLNDPGSVYFINV
jgi:hypothetical protein